MRLKTLRIPLAALAALTAALVGGPASAEQDPAPVTGDIELAEGLELRGRLDGERFDVWANVIGLKPHGSQEVLQVYCIDIETPLDQESPYAEGEWEESGVANLEQVRWVLFNGHPNVGAKELIEASGAEVNEAWSSEHLWRVAYAGTQAAVWHFTDDWRLLTDNPVKGGNNGEDEAVLAIYEHLTEAAERLPDPSEYTVDLEGEESASYEDGRFGPYTIRSNAGPVTLSAEGGRLVDAEGREVDALGDGEDFYIELDDGSDTITVTGNAAYDLPVGRVFLATTAESISGDAVNPVKSGDSQKLILAQPREGEIPAEWRFALDAPATEPPTEEAGAKLPTTGAGLTIAFAAGLALLIGGMTVLALAKRGRATP